MADEEDVLRVLGCIGIVLLVLGLIIAGPFISLWAIYTIWDLPETAQVYDIYHWLAALFMGGMIGGTLTGISQASKKS